jgi:hypothetical protein
VPLTTPCVAKTAKMTVIFIRSGVVVSLKPSKFMLIGVDGGGTGKVNVSKS